VDEILHEVYQGPAWTHWQKQNRLDREQRVAGSP
jgi:hypothetical protein